MLYIPTLVTTGCSFYYSLQVLCVIDQFRYIKIQSQTVDLRTRLLGIKPHTLCIYSPEPRTEVYCLRLNFKISNLSIQNISAVRTLIAIIFRKKVIVFLGSLLLF